jgi:hypothetical protein
MVTVTLHRHIHRRGYVEWAIEWRIVLRLWAAALVKEDAWHKDRDPLTNSSAF